MRRSRQQGLARMQIAIVHIEAQILENLVTGIELDTFIRKSTRIDILRPSVYTCRLDHILPVDKKAVNSVNKLPSKNVCPMDTS